MYKIIEEQFNHFSKSDFFLKRQFLNGLIIFCTWAIPSFMFVSWSSNYHPEVEFYRNAINEGIGPNLWNVIGSFGLFSFGLTITFPNFSWLADIAWKVLSSTYAIGSLSFGLLLGQWVFLLINNNLIWWKLGLFGVTSGLLLVILFFYNLALWYFSFLIQQRNSDTSPFLIKIGQMHLLWRIVFGLAIMGLVSLLFLSEK